MFLRRVSILRAEDCFGEGKTTGYNTLVQSIGVSGYLELSIKFVVRQTFVVNIFVKFKVKISNKYLAT